MVGWIMEHALDRKDWIAQIDASILERLIQEEKITREQMMLLFGMDETDEQQIEAYELLTMEERIEAFLLEMEVVEEPEKWLLFLLKEQAVANLGTLLSSYLTEEQIEELLKKAMEERNHSEEALEELPAREFHLEVGLSTGSAYLSNEGDIHITQRMGNMTIGQVTSTRGDLYLAALEGSILADSQTQGAHLIGRKMKLQARDSIGEESNSLKTEMQEHEVIIIAGVDRSIYDSPLPEAEPDDKYYQLELVPILDEDGNPMVDEEGNPLMEWALKILIRYDQIRVFNQEANTAFYGEAKLGSLYVEELTGDFGIGIVTAGENASIRTPGSIINIRSEEETEAGYENLTAKKNAVLYAQDGTIGTLDNPMKVHVDGQLQTEAQRDIVIHGTNDLDILVESVEGPIYLKAENNLTVKNTTNRMDSPKDLILGYAIAGGKAFITAQGTIQEGDRLEQEATVIADSITLIAENGSLGSPENPFEVDTQNGNTGVGTFGAYGNELFITEISGDLYLDKLVADGGNETSGDVVLAVPGNILEAGDRTAIEDAAEAKKQADTLENQAAEAETKAQVLEKQAAELEAYNAQKQKEKDAAEELERQAYEELQKHMKASDDLGVQLQAAIDARNLIQAELQRQIRLGASVETLKKLRGQLVEASDEIIRIEQAKLTASRTQAAAELAYSNRNKQAEEARQIAAKAEEDAKIAREAADAAEKEAVLRRLAADSMKAQAEKLLQKAKEETDQMAIQAEGNLYLSVGENVGSEKNHLSVIVKGLIYIQTDQNQQDIGSVYLASGDTIRIGKIEAPDRVHIDALGDILDEAGKDELPIMTRDLELNALAGGNVGSAKKPFRVSAAEFGGMGENIWIHVEPAADLRVRDITANEQLVITGVKNLLMADQDAVLAADTLRIKATGNLGTADQPIRLNVNHLDIRGLDIFLVNISKLLEIEKVIGKDIQIITEGSMITNPDGEGIIGDNLILKAGGDIGTPENPLKIIIGGIRDIISYHGSVNWKNHYPYKWYFGKDPMKPVPPKPEKPEEPVEREQGMDPVDRMTGVLSLGTATGDNSSGWLWILLMACSLFLGTMTEKERKKKNHQIS